MTANYIERPEPIPETPPEPRRRPQTPIEPPAPAQDTPKPSVWDIRDRKVHDALKRVEPDATEEELEDLRLKATTKRASKEVMEAYANAHKDAWEEDKNTPHAKANKTEFQPFMPLGTDWCDEPFPVDALPAWAGDYVAAAANSAQVPVAMTGPTFLGALAAITRGNVTIRVSDDYNEPAVLWIGPVAPSGERKSQFVRLMMAPLYSFERSINEDLAPLIAADAAKLTSLNAEVTLAENTLKRKNLPPDERNAAETTLAEATERKRTYQPQLPVRLTADDATPEAVIKVLADNNGAIGIVSTEGNLFSLMTGRYTEKPFVEVFLKSHAGDPITVDRVGRPPQAIKDPRLSMTIAIQPSVLAEIGQNKTLRGNGFIARFLFSYPRPTAGTRTFASDAIPMPIRELYLYRMTQLGRDYVNLSQPVVFVLSPGAFSEAENLFKTIEPQLAPGRELEHMKDWGSKLVGAAIRIAGLLHAAENPPDGSKVISEQTMANACRIALFFLAHGKTAQNVMAGQESAEDAQRVLDWASRQGLTQFKVSDLKNESLRRWDGERVNAALQTLINHGLARLMDPSEYAGTGRTPHLMIELRPDPPLTN